MGRDQLPVDTAMREAPANWDNIIADDYWYETKLIMAGVEYTEDAIRAMSTEGLAMVTGDTTPSIGGALSAEINVTLINTNDGALYDAPRMATLQPFIRVASKTKQSEWLPVSQFMIDIRSIDKATGDLVLHGYDAMLRAEQTYFPSVTDADMTAGDIVDEIADMIGVSVSSDTQSIFTNLIYEIPYYAGQYTGREMLQYIAVAYGGNFYINDNNELAFARVAEFIDVMDGGGGLIDGWTAGDDISGGVIEPWNEGGSFYSGVINPWFADSAVPELIDIGYHAQSLSTDDTIEPYDQIVLIVDDAQEVTAGEGNHILECECPFATQGMADLLLLMFQRYTFRPFTASGAILTPLYEFGDYVVIAGETVKPYKRSIKFNSLLPMELSAESNKEVNHEFVYKPATERKIERIAKNTYSQFKIMASEISSKVSQMDYNGNEIASLINQNATTVQIQAQRINLNGAVTANENFSIDTDGTFSAIKGVIGDLIVEDGILTATYTINHTYTQEDLTRIQHIITGTVTPTTQDYLLYDVSGDGRISAVDYVKVKKSVDDEGGKIQSTITINPKSYDAMLEITTNYGTSTTLGGGGINAPMIAGVDMYLSHNADVVGSVTAASFVNSSLLELKNNLKKSGSMLDKVLGTDILTFNFRDEKKDAKPHYGVAIGDRFNCPEEIIAEDGNGVDLYSMISVLWKAVQEQNAILQAFKRIGGGLNKNEAETIISSNTGDEKQSAGELE